MIDQETQEWAALGVLYALPEAEQAAFELRLEQDPALRTFVSELQETAGSLAACLPPVTPSPAVKTRLMKAIQPEAVVSAPARSSGTRNFLPWTLAACFAVTSLLLFQQRRETGEQLAALRNETQNPGLELRLLRGAPEVPANSVAMVAWDEKRQRGIIQLNQVPTPAAGRDYQLWVVDPAYPIPVDGGIIQADSSAHEFRPGLKVSNASNFVITLEKTGGVPKAEGPAVLAGEKL